MLLEGASLETASACKVHLFITSSIEVRSGEGAALFFAVLRQFENLYERILKEA